MTFQQARKHLKKMIKPISELIEGELYELTGCCTIEKQINAAQEKGPGEYTFFYMKNRKSRDSKG